MRLVCDLLRLKTCLLPLLLRLFHILLDQVVHIKLLHITVDQQHLYTPQHRTGDPVDTDTDLKTKAHECGEDWHECIHRLHGIGHIAVRIVHRCLGHQPIIQPLGKPRKERDQHRTHDQQETARRKSSLYDRPGRVRYIHAQKILHL